MKLIRGTNVSPRAVEAIVREYPAIEEFQIYIWRKDELQDEITINLEVKPGDEAQWPDLHRRLLRDLADAGVVTVPTTIVQDTERLPELVADAIR